MKYNVQQHGGGLCFFGAGDCSTKALATLNNNQLLVNENFLTQMTQNINKSVSDVVNTTTKKCESFVSPTQIINTNISGVTGNVTLGEVNQKMIVKIDLKCMQDSNLRTDLIKNVSQSILDSLKSNMDSNTLSKLESNAAASLTQGFMAPPPGNVESNTNIINNIQQQNVTSRNLSNIVTNSVMNKLTNENIQKCIQNAAPNQNVSYKVTDVTGNVTTGKIIQELTADVLITAIQKEVVANQLLESITHNTGVELVDQSKTTGSTTASAAATATQISNGIFESLGNMFSALTLPMIAGSAALVCFSCVIGIVLFLFVFMSPQIMKSAKESGLIPPGGINAMKKTKW